MIKMRSLLLKLAKLFPKSIADKHHDYVGHMVGKLPEEVHTIVLVLDLDEIIIDQVLALKPDLVITHHPFIYGTPMKVFKRDPSRQAMVEKLLQANICLYSYHTNFDEGQGGMNDALADALGLTNIHPLEGDPMARGGELPKDLPIEEFSRFAMKKLGVKYGLLIAEGTPTIKSVAIIGGGGSRTWSVAKEEGYDIYISGDAPHHVRRGIVVNQYNYLDLPHEIERIFMSTMKKRLLEINPTLKITIINHEEPPLPIVINNGEGNR